MKPSKQLKRTFTKQQEHSDCGVACLLSIIKFHEGDGTIESLRELSGTDQAGTTLLGLYQTAQKIGFDTKGVKSSTEAIQQLQFPCILHVNIDDKRLHYLVCYEQKGENFLVGDPAEGLKTINKEELNHIWQSKSVLELKPNSSFKTESYTRKQKQNWLKEFIGNDYITLLVSSIIGVLSTVLGLTLAMFNQKLIDDILPEKDIKLFILIISLVAFLLLARVGLNYLRSFVLQKQNKIFNNRMLGSFFEKLLYLPIGFFESRRTGELIARMNDAQKIQQTISMLIGSVVIDLLMAIVFTIAIFYYHTGLGILSMLFIPFIVLWTYKMSRTISAKQKKVMLAYADNESNYIQKLKEIDAIKVFQKEEKSIEETTSIYQKFQEEAFSLGITGLKFSFPLQVLGIVYSLSIISYATFLIFDDVFTIGQLTAILTISASIFPAIVRIVSA
ncbi:MAG: ABC-type bacteriocin/lantibiotic exporter with double-glycine peptidase domain, partial [Bacteroidia bacterium]